MTNSTCTIDTNADLANAEFGNGAFIVDSRTITGIPGVSTEVSAIAKWDVGKFGQKWRDTQGQGLDEFDFDDH